MPVLNTAHKLRMGATKVDAVYAGLTKVWPPLVNMLTPAQATVEGADITLAQAQSYRLAGWASNYTVNRVGRTHQFGDAAIQVVRPDATAVFLGLCISPSTAGTYGPRIAAEAGRTYTFMAEGRSSAATAAKGNWRPRIQFYDAAGANLGALIEAVIPGIAGAFAPGRVVATAPAGTAALCVGVTTDGVNAANGTEWFYWRRFGLFEGDVPLSAWVSPAVVWGQNLLDIERADCETNTITNGTDVKSGWRQGSGSAGTAQWISADGRHGTHCIKTVVAAAATPIMQPKTSTNTNHLIPVTAGKAYTAIFSAKCSAAIPLSAGGQAYFRYQWFKADRVTSISTYDWTHLEPIPANQWVDWVASAIAPPEAAWCYMNCYQQTSPVLPAGTEYSFDCFAFYEGYVGAWYPP